MSMPRNSVAVVTGAQGLVGASAVTRLAALGFDVLGIDNDARGQFFGADASTASVRTALELAFAGYRHFNVDVRDENAVDAIFREYGPRIGAVVHAAGQPSHDWAAKAPRVDFAVNAVATLNVLEAVKDHAPEATFLFMSSNKVYGDTPNSLPLEALPTRFALRSGHRFANGIDETMSIDQCRHSLFGVSKTAADLMVQEYAKRFAISAHVFRAGCITGASHRAVSDHGFLAYLCRRVVLGLPYRIFGHGGLQVRDNLHADDLAEAFALVICGSQKSGVYNIGGGPAAAISVIEALDAAAKKADRKAIIEMVDEPRYGDHMWWMSDTARFRAAYPAWLPRYDCEGLIASIVDPLLTTAEN